MVQEKLDTITTQQRKKAKEEYKKIWNYQVQRFKKWNISISDQSDDAIHMRSLWMCDAIKLATKKPKKKLNQRKKKRRKIKKK